MAQQTNKRVEEAREVFQKALAAAADQKKPLLNKALNLVQAALDDASIDADTKKEAQKLANQVQEELKKLTPSLQEQIEQMFSHQAEQLDQHREAMLTGFAKTSEGLQQNLAVADETRQIAKSNAGKLDFLVRPVLSGKQLIAATIVGLVVFLIRGFVIKPPTTLFTEVIFQAAVAAILGFALAAFIMSLASGGPADSSDTHDGTK